MINIKTMSLEIPANKNFKRFSLTAEVEVEETFYYGVINEAVQKAKVKYPEANINPFAVRVSFSKRDSEPGITALCEMCIGDGDYIRRTVIVDPPMVKFV